MTDKGRYEKATFAGGCFWCMQPAFDNLDGVIGTMVGYAGGDTPDPSYESVCSGNSGHAECIQVTYDPARIDYQSLLDVFWRNIDPMAEDSQFVDRGPQYRTAVFYHDEGQRRLAEASRDALAQSGRLAGPILTEISPLGVFYPAEDYHQAYYKKNPVRYGLYRHHSGRDEFLKEVWGDEARHDHHDD